MQQILQLWAPPHASAGFWDAVDRPGVQVFRLVLTRSANCTGLRSSIENAVAVRTLPQVAGSIRWQVVGVPGLFLADYASVKAMVQFRRPGVGAHNPDTYLGVVLGACRLGWHVTGGRRSP